MLAAADQVRRARMTLGRRQVTAPQAQAPQAPDVGAQADLFPSQDEVTMGQAQLANQMGAYYRPTTAHKTLRLNKTQ